MNVNTLVRINSSGPTIERVHIVFRSKVNENSTGLYLFRSDRTNSRSQISPCTKVWCDAFGVRMALGAERGHIRLMVLSEVSLLVISGIVIGIPLAWIAARVLSHQLYELSPHDPLTMAGAVGAIITITFPAGYAPARGVSNVDPMVARRYE